MSFNDNLKQFKTEEHTVFISQMKLSHFKERHVVCL